MASGRTPRVRGSSAPSTVCSVSANACPGSVPHPCSAASTRRTISPQDAVSSRGAVKYRCARYRKNGFSLFDPMNFTASSVYRFVRVCWSAGRSNTLSSRRMGTFQYSILGFQNASRPLGLTFGTRSMSFEYGMPKYESNPCFMGRYCGRCPRCHLPTQAVA